MYKEKADEVAYRKKWYADNRAKEIARVLARKRKVVEWYQAYKKTLKCERCPENHPACLDFHHRERTDKIDCVSIMVTNGWSIKRIIAEIANCEVLCSNCHRKEEAERRLSSSIG